MHKSLVLALILVLTGLALARPAAVSHAAPSTLATDDPLPDRTDCDAIQGTDFRSDTEQAWFEANCVDPSETSQSPPPASMPVDTSSTSSPQPPTVVPTPARQPVLAAGSEGPVFTPAQSGTPSTAAGPASTDALLTIGPSCRVLTESTPVPSGNVTMSVRFKNTTGGYVDEISIGAAQTLSSPLAAGEVSQAYTVSRTNTTSAATVTVSCSAQGGLKSTNIVVFLSNMMTVLSYAPPP